jgi:hypothetical protein
MNALVALASLPAMSRTRARMVFAPSGSWFASSSVALACVAARVNSAVRSTSLMYTRSVCRSRSAPS